MVFDFVIGGEAVGQGEGVVALEDNVIDVAVGAMVGAGLPLNDGDFRVSVEEVIEIA